MGLLELTKKYKKIDYEKLKKHNKTLPFNVYNFNEADNTYVLLAKIDTVTTILEKAHSNELFIEKKDNDKYNIILSEDLPEFRKNFETKLSDTKTSLEEKTNALYAYADLLIENTINDINDKKKMEETKDFLALTMDLISVNLSLMDKLKASDDSNKYIFRSSINVAIITMAFLQMMAMRNKDITPKEILNVAQGALFRDIGMTNIPRAILEKKDKLTEEEFGFIKLHPYIGYLTLLNSNTIISKTGMEIILSHHERMDGSGYPNASVGVNIPFFAKVVAICDVYNALISDRSYREALSPFNAAIKLKKEWNLTLDQELLKYFIILCGPKELIDNNMTKV